MASVTNFPAEFEASETSTSFLQEVWKAIGTELAIFGATLVFALLIRAFSGGKKTVGKGGKLAGCTVATPPAAPAAKVPAAQVTAPVKKQQLAPRRPVGQPAGGHLGLTTRGRSPAVAIDEIVNIMKDQPSLRSAGRALQVYQEEVRMAMQSDGLRIHEAFFFNFKWTFEIYTTLVHCAVRAGRYHLVEPLMGDMAEQGVQRPLSFYESAMKQLAGQKQYHLALAVYDRLAADGLRPSAVTCSCLVGFAAEVGELQRAVEFFETLSSVTVPSIRAYMTVLRVHAKRQDFAASLETLRDMDRRSVGLDCLALNVALATGVAADQIEAVVDLVAESDKRSPPVTDVVSYNTLVKGYAQRGDAAGAAKALDQMKARGLSPNAITFNTAMDAAARAGEPARAWKLLEDMRSAGLRPDKFTCSIIIKGLAREPTAKQVHDILSLLHEVDGACDSTLRSTLYHAVLEASARTTGVGGGTALQARVFSQMRSHKVAPSAAAQRMMVQALPIAESQM